MSACKQQPEPETYLIPDGFKGKVNIIFNQPNGSPVLYENGRRVYVIPSNGILLTQFKNEDGFVNHEYYYVGSAGTREKLQIFDNEQETKENSFGVFRAGTTGIYGNSSNLKSLRYKEFYIVNKDSLDNYFKLDYQRQFNELIKQLTGYNF